MSEGSAISTPDVPHRIELTFDLPGTPEQVWDAIATSGGISSWFLPTEVQERAGGSIVLYMGDDASSPGTVTGWEPPHRFAYEEPDWAGLMGNEGAPSPRWPPSSSSRPGPAVRAWCAS